MASVYSQLLGRVNITAPGVGTLFTASPTGVTIIRDVRFVNNDSAAIGTAYLIIGGVGYIVFNLPAGPAGEGVECRIVLSPGDVVESFWTTGYGSTYVSGYLLD